MVAQVLGQARRGASGEQDAVRAATRIHLALVAIILFAMFLRVYQLASQSLWYDEAVTAQVSAQGVADLTRWTADDIQPPLYYYVVAGWTHLAGRSEWSLRFPSAAFGLLAIPLLWVLGRRLFGRGAPGTWAGLIAVLLASLAPLFVYYSQEARMYTMLTCLGALAGYCLLRAMDAARTGGYVWWAAFVLAAATVLYTHYFGLFLLVAYAIYFVAVLAVERLLRLSENQARAQWRPALLAALCIGLLYVPWLPAMLNRYRVDRSYWQGALKMGEALRHVAMSLAMGAPETLREKFALPLLPWFGVAFVLALAALLWQAWQQISARDRASDNASRYDATFGLLFLLLTLLVPVVAVLALVSRTPKFNARYLMLVSPAYLLILAGGAGAALAGVPSRISASAGGRKWSGWPRAARAALAVALIGFVAAVSVQGILRWFEDPTYNKAQWRQLVGGVLRQIGPDEQVLLVSGHAAPAWSYYAPGVPTVDLPDIDVLDVQAVLGFDTGATLSRALAGKQGAWLVQWQADAVDPGGVLPYFLDRAGREVPVQGQYSQLKLRHWQLRPDAMYPERPDPDHSDGANYGHKLALLGWDEPRQRLVTVYWEALARLPGTDYQVSLRVEDDAGHEVAPGWDGRPSSYAFPTGRWQPGKPVFGRYPLPKNLAPGRYYLTLAVYDPADPSGLDVMDVADNPAGKRVRVGPFTVP